MRRIRQRTDQEMIPDVSQIKINKKNDKSNEKNNTESLLK